MATAQSAEAAAFITAQTTGTANTTLLFGDMNMTPGTAAIANYTGIGLQDSFASKGSGSGFSCCQDPNLDNTSSKASERIDYVFVKPGTAPSAPTIGSSQLVLTDRVNRSTGSGQIWVSDHFGVLTTLEF